MGLDRLSPQDALFLHVEDDHQPMHVGALAYLEAAPFLDGDGRFDIDAVRERIGSRLHLVPRFRKRIRTIPLGQGRPVWIDDEHFDLAFHVRLTAVPTPGSEAQVEALVGRLQSSMLDRRRPLWEIWFVEGVADGRVALVQKTHHCLIDGMSGIDVATVLFDLEPDPPPVEVPEWRPEVPPDDATLLVESLLDRTMEPGEMVRSVRAAFRMPSAALGRITDVARTVADLGDQPERLPFNVAISPHRRFEVARVPLQLAKDIKATRAVPGATVNDVVLTACAGALRRFLDGRDLDVDPDLDVRAMVPVSVRDESEQMALGNRVSMMTADLPVGEDDPLERLRLVHRHMAAMKESHQVVGAEALVGLTGYAPATLLSLGARLAVRAMPVNTVVTNVPGPQFPLYCNGARVLEGFPYVGLVDGIALLLAVISYDGQLGFGLTGDRDVMPDLAVVARGIEQSFAELAQACGLDLHVRRPSPAGSPGSDDRGAS